MLDNTKSSITYRGGEERLFFPIPFPFLEPDHIRVHVTDSVGRRRSLAAGVDYTVTAASEDGGEVTLLNEPPTADETLTVTRLVPLTQEVLFHNQGPNSPRAMETAVDKLTMIAQQLRTELDSCLTAPEGVPAEELSALLAGGIESVAALDARVSSLASDVTGKAAVGHYHSVPDIAGLTELLVEKAGRDDVAAALAGKAEAVHNHGMEAIADLIPALERKVDTDDPRLAQSGGTSVHAASHAVGGEDRLYPEDLGLPSPPPEDGKRYLATGGGWVEYIPTDGEGGEGGTLDHMELGNRDAPDQHPQSAVTSLVADLTQIRADIGDLAVADNELGAALDEVASLFPQPGEGAGGDILVKAPEDKSVWKTPVEVAATLPVMSESRKGVARLAADAGLELDAGGALRIAADSLVSKANIEARLGGLEARIESAASALAQLHESLGELGAMAWVEDAPANGMVHARSNGSWREVEQGSGGGSGMGAYAGEIRLLPFRGDELPDGWYFCNGDRFFRTTAQGAALAALPAGYRADWSIDVDDAICAVPDLFHEGRGCFMRSVDGSARSPGSVEGDAIRNITGSFSLDDSTGLVLRTFSSSSTLEGAFTTEENTDKTLSVSSQSLLGGTAADLLFDASLCVPTAEENRPLNIGMTPAIYLGE